MEQIRQILAQLSLHLDLSIAMCDVLDDHGKRLAALETSSKALKTRIDVAERGVSEIRYKLAGDSYNARRARKGLLKDSDDQPVNELKD